MKTDHSHVGLGRRRFLSRLCGFVATAIFLHPKLSSAQEKEIDLEAYQKWIEEVRRAAERLAEETGTRSDPDVAEEFEKHTTESLEEKGYRVPSPPTGLTVF